MVRYGTVLTVIDPRYCERFSQIGDKKYKVLTIVEPS